VRLDLQEDSLLTGSSILIFLRTGVFLRHLVDMIFCYVSSYLFDDATLNHHELVRIALFCYRESNLWVLLHVSMLDTTYCRVDEHVVTVSIDPRRCDLGGAIWVHGCEEDEVLAFQDFPCIIIQFRHF